LYHELELERSRLEFVFLRAPSFLAILRGPEFTFDLVNEAYYQLVGDRALEGRPMLEALPELRDQGFVQLLESVMRTGEPYLGREAPVRLVRTPGEPAQERFVDFLYLPLIEPDGTRSGIITHGTDVTDHVRARREVERLLSESEQDRTDAEAARQEAEAANRSKTDFLSAMSHELRTPLNAIGGYAELLEMGIHGPVTDEQRNALRRITSGQQHLLILINDILSYARLESGRLEFTLRPLSVSSLLAGVEPLILLQAQARGIALSIRACDSELQLVADEERVRQILLNLANNAIKFTAPGGWVALSCEVDDDWARLHVQDSGRGIEPQDQELIFDAFSQAGRRLNEPVEGVGLGLAISRDLARTMGGDVTVVSAPGVGSTFTLRLPRRNRARER
jgi:signal transduction histidine kinase